jgi:hypothetical protein
MLPQLHIPPSRIVKNFGQKYSLFSTVPKNRAEILEFHRIFLWNWTYISFFSVYAQKLPGFWAQQKKIAGYAQKRS